MDFWCRSSSGSFSQLSSFLSSSSSLSSGDVRRASTIPRTRRTTKRANSWRRAIQKFKLSTSRRWDRRDPDGGKRLDTFSAETDRAEVLDVTSQLSRRCQVSSVSRTRYAWSWQMQLSELLIRGLSRIQKWPEMYSDWHYVWEAEEGIQTQKLKNTCPSLLSPNLEKPGQLQEPPQPGGGFHPKNRSDLDCHRFETWTWSVEFHMKQNRSLIFTRDLPLKLTLDHQNVSMKMAPASSYPRSCWWSPLWQISNL